MKALVLEQENGVATVLREDGQVLRARRDWAVGDQVDWEDNVIPFPRRKRRWARGVAAAALAVTLLTGSYTYTTAWACSYVSLETEEASVELAVNRLGQVIQVTALEEDEASRALAEDLTRQLKQKPVEEAVDAALKELRAQGKLDGETPVIAGITDGDADRAARIAQRLEEDPGSVQAVEVSPSQREEARANDRGSARFVLEQQGMTPFQPGEGPPEAPAPQEQDPEEGQAPDQGQPPAQEGREASEQAPAPEQADPGQPQEQPDQPAWDQAPPEVPQDRTEETSPQAPARDEQPQEESTPRQGDRQQPGGSPPGEGQAPEAPQGGPGEGPQQPGGPGPGGQQ